MKKEDTTTQSYWNRIQGLSFVLAVFVVIRHNSSFANYDQNSVVVSYGRFFYNVLRNSITEIAVPLFFIIAGLNFFRGYTPKNYKLKLKGRIKSLVVPYLVWNCIYVLFNVIISIPVFSQYFIGRETFDISLRNIVTSCIYHWTCNGHFWFVFNLIIFTLTNPIVYFLFHKKVLGGITLVFLFSSIFVFNVNIPAIFIYRTDSIFYYYLGAYLGLNYMNISVMSIQCNNTVKLTGGILLLTTILLLFNIHTVLRPVIILVASIGMYLISAVWNNNVNLLFTGGTTFIVYAIHGILQPVIVKCLYLFFSKEGFWSIINFLFSVGLTVALSVLMRSVNKKYFPAIDHILAGWRR